MRYPSKLIKGSKAEGDFGSVIDQIVRRVVERPADGVDRTWTQELTSGNDRLPPITSSRSSEKIKVLLRGVLVRAKSLAKGQPLSDAAVNDAERTVFDATAMSYWYRATGAVATEQKIQSLHPLMGIQVMDVEADELGEGEAVWIVGTLDVIVSKEGIRLLS